MTLRDSWTRDTVVKVIPTLWRDPTHHPFPTCSSGTPPGTPKLIHLEIVLTGAYHLPRPSRSWIWRSRLLRWSMIARRLAGLLGQVVR